jgi:hypothetical protein
MTANCYTDPSQILQIEAKVQQLLMLALEHRRLRLRIKDHDSITDGVYRACNWCLTEQGLACILRMTTQDTEPDSAIDVSLIEDIQVS